MNGESIDSVAGKPDFSAVYLTDGARNEQRQKEDVLLLMDYMLLVGYTPEHVPLMSKGFFELPSFGKYYLNQ